MRQVMTGKYGKLFVQLYNDLIKICTLHSAGYYVTIDTCKNNLLLSLQAVEHLVSSFHSAFFVAH